MGDLKNVKLLWLKGGLFLSLGIMSSGWLVVRHPEIKTVLLLLITVWAFCRSYYFAFYVIEKYVDSSFRFAGLTDFFRYMLGQLVTRKPTREREFEEHTDADR